jgi:hypothetical protein
MKKRSPSSGQNGQLVHWWLLVHSGQIPEPLGWAHKHVHTTGGPHYTPEPETLGLTRQTGGTCKQQQHSSQQHWFKLIQYQYEAQYESTQQQYPSGM